MGANTIHSGDGPDYGSRFYAGLAAAYKINPNLEASGWINNSYRNPTFTDLYYKSPTQTGNLNLKPEEAVATQLELRFTNHRTRASISTFYRYGYNIIDWIRETGSDQWRAANITNIETIGTDLNFTYTIPAGFVSRITASWSWMEVTKKSGQYHSLYATDYLRHKTSIGLHHKILETLNASWHFSYQKREGSYPGPDNTEVPYKGFFLADLKIQMNKKTIQPFAEVTNLFNTHYLYLGNLPQPGRWVKGGVQINIK
jgi:vitamin B12 transporter